MDFDMNKGPYHKGAKYLNNKYYKCSELFLSSYHLLLSGIALN